jgi:hypothetical protein
MTAMDKFESGPNPSVGVGGIPRVSAARGMSV